MMRERAYYRLDRLVNCNCSSSAVSYGNWIDFMDVPIFRTNGLNTR